MDTHPSFSVRTERRFVLVMLNKAMVYWQKALGERPRQSLLVYCFISLYFAFIVCCWSRNLITGRVSLSPSETLTTVLSLQLSSRTEHQYRFWWPASKSACKECSWVFSSKTVSNSKDRFMQHESRITSSIACIGLVECNNFVSYGQCCWAPWPYLMHRLWCVQRICWI